MLCIVECLERHAIMLMERGYNVMLQIMIVNGSRFSCATYYTIQTDYYVIHCFIFQLISYQFLRKNIPVSVLQLDWGRQGKGINLGNIG